MKKIFILDTNVLLHDPGAIDSFADNHVIIPIEVIEELDLFKRDTTELGQNSRAVSFALSSLTEKGNLGEGIRLDAGGLLQIYAGKKPGFSVKFKVKTEENAGDRILNLAIEIKDEFAQAKTIIVSKNINLRLKAQALGIFAEDYEESKVSQVKLYTGHATLSVSDEEIAEFKKSKVLPLTAAGKFSPNEYILLNGVSSNKVAVLGRISGAEGNGIVSLPETNGGVLGIKPLNLEQTFALDALLDDNIKLVTLSGRAGTGKTLLAVAAGLHKVLKECKYNKLLVSRPTMPMGRDIGFIPGDVEEKMRPWMQPIYDALELIIERDRQNRKRILPPDIGASEEIGVEPLAYIRGRSIPHQYFVIDEAQNLTRHEIKTIITRVGHGSKIVITGDPEQIDNPYVDSFSNGFSHLVNQFKNEKISAHITLSKGERSQLAEIAAEIL